MLCQHYDMRDGKIDESLGWPYANFHTSFTFMIETGETTKLVERLDIIIIIVAQAQRHIYVIRRRDAKTARCILYLALTHTQNCPVTCTSMLMSVYGAYRLSDGGCHRPFLCKFLLNYTFWKQMLSEKNLWNNIIRLSISCFAAAAATVVIVADPLFVLRWTNRTKPIRAELSNTKKNV